jgi:hypothetical protein
MLPQESLAAPPPGSGPSPVKKIPESKAAEPKVTSKPVAPVPVVPPSVLPDKPVAPDTVFSLSVPWDKPVAAAVFQRAGYLWAVFDRRQDLDISLFRRAGGDALVSVEQLPQKEATVLRLVIRPDYHPSVRRDGLLWVIDLLPKPAALKQIIGVAVGTGRRSSLDLVLSVAEAGTVLSVADPEVGDMMRVVPVIPVGAGVSPGRESTDLDLLPTVQGIAIIPHMDGLDISSSRTAVTIGTSAAGGLRLSSGNKAASKEGRASNPASILDVPGWMQGGPNEFDAERHILLSSMAGLPPTRRGQAHLAAARFFFANGFCPEALGYLRLSEADEPALAETASFRAVRGACHAALHHWDLAQADLDNPLLDDDPECRFWRAAAHAGDGGGADQEKAMVSGLMFAKSYPHALKWPLVAQALVSAVAVGDDDGAQRALDMLDREKSPNRNETDQLAYLHGLYDEMTGKFAKAITGYGDAADGENREFRAKGSRAKAELELRTHKITAKEAADRLDRLRFAWREPDFEFALLRRFAELQRDAGDYASALRALRSLATNYTDDKGSAEVTRMMNDIFASLYLDGAADNLHPVSAIGLYDEFRDLTPSGPKGDEMIRKLADRLVAVDLLDRAAGLLKHQVGFRLQGLDKARVGTQLALLDLLDKNPKDAVEALQSSGMEGLPGDLVRQRRHLQARALADLDRVPEAITQLSGDDSSEAAMLRAEIQWRAQNWPEAAAAFEAMVPRPERGVPLDDAAAKMTVSWATALVLANDEHGLAGLRRTYGPVMAVTPYKDGFTLLTSALDKDVPNMPAVAAKIKEAEGFQSFMSNYRKRLQSSGLSAIN